MKLRVSLICFLCFAVSCKGLWTSKNVYRPRHPKFKILKQEFIGNPLIDTNHLYISTVNYIDDGKKKSVYNCAGFYSDGKHDCLFFGGRRTRENEPGKHLEDRLLYWVLYHFRK